MDQNRKNDQQLADLSSSVAADCDAIIAREVRGRRQRWLVGLVIVGVTSTVLAIWFYKFMLFRRQAGSNQALTYAAWALEKFKESHGGYPAGLDELALADEYLVDSWGHRIYYMKSGEGYVLVSFGRDGKPDGTDLAKVRKPGLRNRECQDYNNDLIRTDINWYRQCAK